MENYIRLKKMGEDLQQLKYIGRQSAWTHQWDLEDQLLRKNKVILVTDRQQHIVFATHNIFLLNGYSQKEVIGKSPKIFQGGLTSPTKTALIRHAVNNNLSFHVSVTNYKKSGALYNCDIQGFPVSNRKKTVEHFIAFESLCQEAI